MLTRKPLPKETKIVTEMRNKLRDQVKEDTGAAHKILKVGDSKRDESIDAVEHAAWAGICLAVLNLDEAITKE